MNIFKWLISLFSKSTPHNKTAEVEPIQTDKTKEMQKFITETDFDEVAKKKSTTPKTEDEELKYADADEESLEIFKQAKSLAESKNISFKEALLQIKEI